MAENVKYLSSVPPQSARVVPVEAMPAGGEAAVDAVPAVPAAGREAVHVPSQDYAGSVSSKSVAMAALILSLALILLLAGLIIRRRMRRSLFAEPDMVELDRQRQHRLECGGNEDADPKAGSEVPVAPSPVVSFRGEEGDGAEAAADREEGPGTDLPRNDPGSRKRISVKPPPKPKRRF